MPLRAPLLAAALLALAACETDGVPGIPGSAATDTAGSIARLESGLAARAAADRAATADFTAGLAPDPAARRDARSRLMADARRDLEAAGAGEPAQRLGFYQRAATKAQAAGSALDTAVLDRAVQGGRAQCAALGPVAPPRDCALIDAAPVLAAVQQARDAVFDARLTENPATQVLPPAAIVPIVGGVRDLADAAQAATVPEPAAPLARRAFAEAWCHAAEAVLALRRTGTPESPERTEGRQANELLVRGPGGADPGPDLLRRLRGGGIDPVGAAGAYVWLSQAVDALLPEITLRVPADALTARDLCRRGPPA